MNRRLLRAPKLGLLFAILIASACSDSGSGKNLQDGKVAGDTGLGGSFFSALREEPFRLEKINLSGEKQVADDIARGRYLVQNVAACGSCHLQSNGTSLAGGQRMVDSFGEVFAANISPDPKTGIGHWNVAHTIRALRSSIGKSDQPLSLDVHQGYAWASDSDLRAIATYLSQLTPVKNRIQRRDLGMFDKNRFLFFPRHHEILGYVPSVPHARSVEYGKYLSTTLGQCSTCHQSIVEDLDSAPSEESDEKGFMAGAFELLSLDWLSPDEPQKQTNQDSTSSMMSEEVSAMVSEGNFPIPGPDIRGSNEGRLSHWSIDDYVRYLQSGRNPKGQQSLVDVCRWKFTAGMTKDDKLAIALFLKSR